MEFLKELLGKDLFEQVTAKINEHNGNEANKDKQIKLANLASGEYVGKLKHDDLNTQLQSKIAELDSANDLIAQLKKGTKDNEGLQGKIAQYETQVTELQSELADTKLKSALKVALLSEKAVDVDYLTFKLQEKLREKGESLELDENDNLRNWDSQLEGLKTQFPNMFETAAHGGEYQPYDPKGLPKGDAAGGKLTKETILKKPYNERMALYAENPEAYKAAMNS